MHTSAPYWRRALAGFASRARKYAGVSKGTREGKSQESSSRSSGVQSAGPFIEVLSCHFASDNIE